MMLFTRFIFRLTKLILINHILWSERPANIDQIVKLTCSVGLGRLWVLWLDLFFLSKLTIDPNLIDAAYRAARFCMVRTTEEDSPMIQMLPFLQVRFLYIDGWL